MAINEDGETSASQIEYKPDGRRISTRCPKEADRSFPLQRNFPDAITHHYSAADFERRPAALSRHFFFNGDRQQHYGDVRFPGFLSQELSHAADGDPGLLLAEQQQEAAGHAVGGRENFVVEQPGDQ